MSFIIQNNRKYTIADLTDRHETLPKGVYILRWNQDKAEFYLQREEDFKLPAKIYGDHSVVSRWIRSIEVNSEKNTGILLSGMRGSGKTVTAQKLCIDSGLPVILVTEPFGGTAFIEFISSPNLGKFILFVDEFEKVYNLSKDNTIQDHLLSLMDGMFPTSIVFLLTVNQNKVSENLVNRPGRIKYRCHYKSLTEEEMYEVANDLLINKEHMESIPVFFNKVGMCTYDLLVSVIKEMNLFGEDAVECGKHMNLSGTSKSYKVYELYKGKECAIGTKTINIFNSGELWFNRDEWQEDDNYWPDEESSWIHFPAGQYLLTKEGNYVFVQDANSETCVKLVEIEYDELLF